jgi:hypothetical protein
MLNEDYLPYRTRLSPQTMGKFQVIIDSLRHKFIFFSLAAGRLPYFFYQRRTFKGDGFLLRMRREW